MIATAFRKIFSQQALIRRSDLLKAPIAVDRKPFLSTAYEVFEIKRFMCESISLLSASYLPGFLLPVVAFKMLSLG